MVSSIIFNPDLIRKYDKSGPRYTSYPTAVQFTEEFGIDDYKAQIEKSNQSGSPLSLYFHIPFCDTVCFYCGCSKVATKDRSKAQPYLDHVYKEMALQSELFDTSRVVEQLHWGGGTPTFINHEQMRELMERTRQYFTLLDDDSGEYSIEIDPREATAETISVLRSIGFNRMSLGVQDFNPEVQKAVNRIQSEEETSEVIQAARDCGFHSISLDLIYGLPHQSVETFDETLDKILALSPDRLSVFNYAHLPEMFKPQRRINEVDLPSADEKLSIMQHCIEKLTTEGYEYIGMDHFARPDDELALAQKNKTLYRNFQGYSTHADCDLVAFGITSIGKVADCYSQNLKTIDEYYQAIDNNRFPVFRGVVLDDDDRLRREVITQLICHFELDKARISNEFNINFDEYFTIELDEMNEMASDGLVKMGDIIRVTPSGKLLIRNICMVFDKYMRKLDQARFSKVI
ncbi:MAG: oxygen-independent coproporphyrinogen III oxidase [Gammaproteobacteria bacterium]